MATNDWHSPDSEAIIGRFTSACTRKFRGERYHTRLDKDLEF